MAWKSDGKQLTRIPVVLVFFYLSVMLSYLFLILAHEAGHYVAASLINQSAISGFYFPMENSYKMFFFQKLTEIPECPGTAACVVYKASVLDSFGPYGGFIVSLAGVAATTAILFVLLKVKHSMELDTKNSEGLFRTAEASFLLGAFLVFINISLAWVSDGAKAFLPFFSNTWLTASILTVFLIPLVLVCILAFIETAIYVAPVYAPHYAKFRKWARSGFRKEEKRGR